MLFALAILGAAMAYFLVKKPEIVAMILFSLIIARMNIDLNGLPLNGRALLTLALFGRIMIDKEGQQQYKNFLTVPWAFLLILFILYVLFISFWQGLFDISMLKELASSILSAYCCFHYFFKKNAPEQLKVALIVAGVICFADLAYTYTVFGSFPVRRVYFQYAGVPPDITDEELTMLTNHNFFGQICGMTFVFILCDFVRHRNANRYLIALLPFMFLGVLMSTSRSSLLSLLTMTFFIFMTGVRYVDQKKKILRISLFSITAIITGILLFTLFGSLLNLETNFVDEIVFRMTEEPVAMIKKALGQNYNIQNLGSMDWREESSSNAYAAYFNLPVNEQLFGIGMGGFEFRNLGQGYNAHNALLLILIENGVVGLMLFLILTGGVLIRAAMKRNFSAAFVTIVFIIIYGLGQNRELTSSTTYLFVFTLVAELEYLKINKMKSYHELRIQK